MTLRPKAAFRVRILLLALAGFGAVLLGFSTGAAAKCLPIAGGEARFIPASLPAKGSVEITYVGHSSFLIETPEGASVVTDYNGVNRPEEPPSVVTMNNAHTTHYTDFPDPEIDLVLRGWDPAGGTAIHEETYRDLMIWNVPTNVRSYGGVRYNGNSIFIFKVAELCIAHLGHLHHVLSDKHLAELGLIDVLMVPVDGGFTLNQDEMFQVIQQISPSVVIPMHYFGGASLARFVALVGERYDVVYNETPNITLSRLNLPYRKLIVLPGY